jgi:Protein of unknown function (DUF3551)
MRLRAVFAAASAASVLATIASISPAAAGRYCLQGREWGYPGNCQFQTYRQCEATASGTLSYCGTNPRYAFAPRPRYWHR